ncbi:MAG: BrnA antitoxin family protein [Acidiferrobacter thiooxydans]
MKAHYDFSKARRGAVVPAAPTKTRITIRLDEDILAWFRQQVNEAGGGNYQSLINDALRDHIERGTAQPLEETLRRIIREEMQRAG